MNFTVLHKRKKFKIQSLNQGQNSKECQSKIRLLKKKEKMKMNLQPQIIILLLIIKIEPQPIKIELKFMEFISSLGLHKKLFMLQVLEELFVKQLQQNRVYHFKPRDQEHTGLLRSEVLIKIIFTINCSFSEIKESKATRS